MPPPRQPLSSPPHAPDPGFTQGLSLGSGIAVGVPTIGGGRIPVWENIVTPVGRRRPPQCTGECPPARVPEKEEEEEEEQETGSGQEGGGWVPSPRSGLCPAQPRLAGNPLLPHLPQPISILVTFRPSKTCNLCSSTFEQAREILATMLSDFCVN